MMCEGFGSDIRHVLEDDHLWPQLDRNPHRAAQDRIPLVVRITRAGTAETLAGCAGNHDGWCDTAELRLNVSKRISAGNVQIQCRGTGEVRCEGVKRRLA